MIYANLIKIIFKRIYFIKLTDFHFVKL